MTDTVCHPTKQRQKAAVDLAKQCDVVIVIGGARSNNTRELVQTCAEHCSRVYHAQTESDVRAEWLADAEIVGITAGTSTPDSVIEGVEQAARSFQPGQESNGLQLAERGPACGAASSCK